MKKYEFILFDLDGTITDPGVGITNSVAYALEKFGIVVEDRTQLYPFIGPPLIDSFQKYYGFSEDEARLAVDYYREYYCKKGIFENEVYDGIEKLLRNLDAAGKRVCLATSKPEEFAKMILDHFQLSQYFDYIGGANMDETRTKKSEVIEYVLKEYGAQDSSKILMIGDREYDVLGAKEYDIDTVGVLFGYGSREELELAGAVHIAETVEEIEPFIL